MQDARSRTPRVILLVFVAVVSVLIHAMIQANIDVFVYCTLSAYVLIIALVVNRVKHSNN